MLSIARPPTPTIKAVRWKQSPTTASAKPSTFMTTKRGLKKLFSLTNGSVEERNYDTRNRLEQISIGDSIELGLEMSEIIDRWEKVSVS